MIIICLVYSLCPKSPSVRCFVASFPVRLSRLLFKADMNSDILLQTTAIFFLTNFYLKQGIGSVYVMVDFICMGLL